MRKSDLKLMGIQLISLIDLKYRRQKEEEEEEEERGIYEPDSTSFR